MTNYDTQAQLADLQNDADFEEWADARCAEYEAEADARHCLGGANDARSTGWVDCTSTGWVDCTPAENAYYAELEAREEADGEARWEAEAELARMRYYERQAEMATLNDPYYDDPCW